MRDERTPDADAIVESELATAGVASKDFTDAGYAFNSDINITELQKAATGLITMSAATYKAGLDSVALSRATNAAMVDNLAALSNQLVQDFGNKAMHRHSEIAADRQWNINETDFYAAVAAGIAAAMAEKSFEN